MELSELDAQERRATREVVKFYLRPVLDKDETQKEGRPIHKDAEYIKIYIPGDRNLEVDRPIRIKDQQQYAREYMAFKANRSQDEGVGTLLSAWGAISTSTVEDYRFQKVKTVEQLAGLSDSAVSRLGRGTLAHRKMAQDFIDASRGKAPMLRLQAELQEERTQRAALELALKEQGDRIDALSAEKGRPVAAVREVVAAPNALAEQRAAHEAAYGRLEAQPAPTREQKAKRVRSKAAVA
jgi:hypothetical protein